MPLFTYKATDEAGKIFEDTIQAGSKDNAVTTLQSQGVKVLTIKKVGGLSSFVIGGISTSDKANFCRFMSTMLRSGMSVPDAVEIIRQESKNQKLQNVLADLSYQTKKGRSISSVLEQHPDDFDRVFLTMVKVGEESGTLEKTFEYLATQLTSSHELSQKVKGSMMYPAVIVVAMVGNGLLMAIFVLPRLAGAFLKLDVPLPSYTRILLTLGDFFGKYPLFVIGGTIVAGLTFFSMFIIKPTRILMIRVISRAPVVRNVIKNIDVARFSRTLSTLLRSGVPIIDSLDVSAESVTSPKIKAETKRFSPLVAKGQSLSDIMAREKTVFPSIMVQTIRAGEKSGSLEQVLGEVADFYEKEVEFSLKNLTSLIEPVLMLVIGVVVGIMVIIMIAPIYSIIGGLQQTIQQP
jgi:type IV pilus assembly protein PilC